MREAEVIADLARLGGAGLSVTDLDGRPAAAPVGPGVVSVGVHRRGPLPSGDLQPFDILLSADPAAPRPWVGLADLQPALDRLAERTEQQPVAATVAAQVIRMSLRLDFEQALLLESLAYSMLLASEGFRTWRAENPPRLRGEDGAARVASTIEGGMLRIELNRPAARNAFDARMRDELVEALEFAQAHPDAPRVLLSGRGAAFSSGGDLDEFGRADDVGRAHLIRTLRSPARLVHQLRDRITAHVHGACIGAGIEVPAAAGRIVAASDAVFRLPEVGMGLIPGAGGTVTIPRRIGRRRACYMAISGVELGPGTALAWGLVDEAAP
jgi:enoyl-CoA hydratase/carnithine racemase